MPQHPARRISSWRPARPNTAVQSLSEAVASVTELRSKSTTLLENAKAYRGIMIQRNNEPVAVLLSFDQYIELSGEKAKRK